MGKMILKLASPLTIGFSLIFMASLCLSLDDKQVSAAPEMKGKHYIVYLLAGQSNMDGRANVKDLKGPLESYAGVQQDVLIRYSAGGLKRPLRVSNGLEPLHPGCSGTPQKVGGPEPTNNFGPELSFGRAIADASPGKNILLIKFSEGGTNLHSDWNPNKKDTLYEKFLKFVNETQEMIKKEGGTCEIRGMLWLQGESDTSSPTEKYQAQLTELITKARADLAVKELPFLIGQVCDNGGRNTVVNAQKAVAKTLTRSAFVESDGLETFDKGTHFDAASQIEFGKRFAREMLKISQ